MDCIDYLRSRISYNKHHDFVCRRSHDKIEIAQQKFPSLSTGSEGNL